MQIDIPNGILDRHIAREAAFAVNCTIGFAALKKLPGQTKVTVTGNREEEWCAEYETRYIEMLDRLEREAEVKG